MKVRWIIERKDGSIYETFTEQNAEPISGDGAMVEGIQVVVGSKVTTPTVANLDKHDIVVTAREQ